MLQYGIFCLTTFLVHPCMTLNFKYSKRIFMHSRLKQVSCQLHVRRPSYLCFFHWPTQCEHTIVFKKWLWPAQLVMSCCSIFEKYIILRGWIKCATRSTFTIQHTLSGHIHLGSHTTNVAQLGCHMTNIEHFWSHVMNIAHFSSMLSHRSNTALVLRLVFIEKTPSVAFVNASSLVGDAKRLRLPCFTGFCHESPSLCLILYPVMNPPTQKLYIN